MLINQPTITAIFPLDAIKYVHRNNKYDRSSAKRNRLIARNVVPLKPNARRRMSKFREIENTCGKHRMRCQKAMFDFCGRACLMTPHFCREYEVQCDVLMSVHSASHLHITRNRRAKYVMSSRYFIKRIKNDWSWNKPKLELGDKNLHRFCGYIIYVRSTVKSFISNVGAYGFSYIYIYFIKMFNIQELKTFCLNRFSTRFNFPNDILMFTGTMQYEK